MVTAAALLRLTTDELGAAGCVAAADEAAELIEACGTDTARLRELVARRCVGEPLAWLIGAVRFCGETVLVHPGVYVPRWQSEPLALEAVDRLPRHGLAVDLCTGSGAVAAVLARRRPFARVVGTEIDPLALACARANGVEVFEGDMASPLPEALYRRADVVTAIVPYVPTGELGRLPRDVLAYEPTRALDGGEDGLHLLVAAARAGADLLRPGGSLLVELGGDQDAGLRPVLGKHGFSDVKVVADEDGDVRALVCRR